jgi:hypothetical protein
VVQVNEAEMIAMLKIRTGAIRLHGRGIRVIDRMCGPPGLFMPSAPGSDGKIYLQTGRLDRKTLFTLCHEIGHFWAHATGRQTKAYPPAQRRQARWENEITVSARNNPIILNYLAGSPWPPPPWEKVLQEEMAKKTNPLAEAEKGEILKEEARAWCYGFGIALALRLTNPDEFVDDANHALDWYRVRLQLRSAVPDWSPTACSCDLAAEDRCYVLELTKSAAPEE